MMYLLMTWYWAFLAAICFQMMVKRQTEHMQWSMLTIFVENGDLLPFIPYNQGEQPQKSEVRRCWWVLKLNLEAKTWTTSAFVGSQITFHCNAKNMFHIKLPHQALLNQGVDDSRINQWNPLQVVMNPRQGSHSYYSTTNEAYIFHLYGKYSLGNGVHPCMP